MKCRAFFQCLRFGNQRAIPN
ncbi:hypothetical protein RB2654_14275 [Rhodobacterales bacterium HTCC2654]|uniref:Uncharacterized protein n=1 Tax=Maritimibacter alkaliphilus HTCC2654 TaxID=314271 RepID=A3VGQ4_9RHOB|nr:hypothetical protein RB2654_14275 [Rhodobacterales bacterium HTCC2654] [Maritimibacter alkaliphilus HTCC2654]